MRNRFVHIAIVLLVTTALGCGLLDSFTKFRLKYDKEFTIPSGIPSNIPYDVPSPYFPTNSEQYFNENDTKPDLVEGCKLESMYAVITAPANEDFSFLQSIHIFLGAPGMADVKVASAEGQAMMNDTLFLQPAGVELLDYIKQDSIRLRVQVLTDEEIQQPIQTRVYGTFLVDAKILGI